MQSVVRFPRPATKHAPIDPHRTLAKLAAAVAPNRTVLYLGSGGAHLAAKLEAKGCTVVGFHSAPVDGAEHGDVPAFGENGQLRASLDGSSYDVIVLGDALAFVCAPTATLDALRQALRRGGYVLAAIPNAAHGALRLAQLQGRDASAARALSYDTIALAFGAAGFKLEIVNRTKHPLFKPAATLPRVSEADFAPEIVAALRDAPDSETLQLIVKALPGSASVSRARTARGGARGKGTEAELARELAAQIDSLRSQLAAESERNASREARLRAMVDARDRLASELQSRSERNLARAAFELARARELTAEIEILRAELTAQRERGVDRTAADHLSDQLAAEAERNSRIEARLHTVVAARDHLAVQLQEAIERGLERTAAESAAAREFQAQIESLETQLSAESTRAGDIRALLQATAADRDQFAAQLREATELAMEQTVVAAAASRDLHDRLQVFEERLSLESKRSAEIELSLRTTEAARDHLAAKLRSTADLAAAEAAKARDATAELESARIARAQLENELAELGPLLHAERGRAATMEAAAALYDEGVAALRNELAAARREAAKHAVRMRHAEQTIAGLRIGLARRDEAMRRTLAQAKAFVRAQIEEVDAETTTLSRHAAELRSSSFWKLKLALRGHRPPRALAVLVPLLLMLTAGTLG